MSQIRIYLKEGGEIRGPFNLDAIADTLKSGRIAGDTPACLEGQEEWYPLQNFLIISELETSDSDPVSGSAPVPPPTPDEVEALLQKAIIGGYLLAAFDTVLPALWLGLWLLLEGGDAFLMSALLFLCPPVIEFFLTINIRKWPRTALTLLRVINGLGGVIFVASTYIALLGSGRFSVSGFLLPALLFAARFGFDNRFANALGRHRKSPARETSPLDY